MQLRNYLILLIISTPAPPHNPNNNDLDTGNRIFGFEGEDYRPVWQSSLIGGNENPNNIFGGNNAGSSNSLDNNRNPFGEDVDFEVPPGIFEDLTGEFELLCKQYKHLINLLMFFVLFDFISSSGIDNSSATCVTSIRANRRKSK